jgi:mannose-6-phosphate isomerase-like protein (cupin superfamily)
MTHQASVLGYDNPVRYLKRKVSPRGGQQEDLHRPGRRRPPPRPGHHPQDHGGELRRRLHDHRGGPPSGRDDPLHTHAREDECNFVLEGELTFDVGGEIVLASAGSFVLKPRGVYHAFCNTGTVHTTGTWKYTPPVSSRATRARWARTRAGRPASNSERATGLSGTRSSSPRSGHASG